MPISSKSPLTGGNNSGGPYTYATSAGKVPNNNGGSVLWAGNIRAGTNVSQALGLTTVGYHTNLGSQIPQSVNPQTGTFKGQSNAFNVMTKGNYIINGYTSTIAGQSNNVIRSPGSYAAKQNNYYTGNIRTTRMVITSGWSYTTGFPINPVDALDTYTPETFPTRAIPGRLTYLIKKTATTVSYGAKND